MVVNMSTMMRKTRQRDDKDNLVLR